MTETENSKRTDPGTEQRDLAVRLAAASVADAIGLYLRSTSHKFFCLADLEWMLVPALQLNQVQFAYVRPRRQNQTNSIADGSEGRVGEQLAPVAVAMVTWAFVSDAVAKKIDAQISAGQIVHLSPIEWWSGKNFRVVDAIGPANLTEKIKNQIDKTVPKENVRARKKETSAA